MLSPQDETPNILFVDDEVNILKALVRVFRNENVRVHLASTAEEALAVLEGQPIQVLVTDQRMPGTDGTALLSQVRERWPDVVRIMLTGFTGMDVAMEAINRGEVFRLLTKPWNDDELRASIRQALHDAYMRAELARLNALTVDQNRRLQDMNRTLEAKVEARTREVAAKHQELQHAYVSTVRALAEAVDAKDSYTRGHSERVGIYASRIAVELGCKRDFIERIYLAGLLHDIGKIGIPDAIITKPGPLTGPEYETIQRHPEIGARILEPVTFLQDIVPCVRHHHEWYDGSARGYPDRLSGRQIPWPSRIILVADTVEAMTSDRPYRRGMSLEEVIREVERYKGSQFDPEVADAFLALIEREAEDFLEKAHKFDIERFLSREVDG